MQWSGLARPFPCLWQTSCLAEGDNSFSGSCSHFVLSCFVFPSLADLEEFIKTAEQGLSRKVDKGDYGGLVEVMGHLLAVKERQSITDAMFEPLKQTIELLKTYEQQLPEEVYKQLEVGERLGWPHHFAKQQMSRRV